MPGKYLRYLSSRERAPGADLSLARYLTFVAGAANAGGFLAVNVYTSHMSGLVASMADNLALMKLDIVLLCIGTLTAFLSGSACTAVLVNWAKRRSLESLYALPLILESILLVLFGLLGQNLSINSGKSVSITVGTLAFLMGLQNALITKISKAEIRTTHVTGMITDIGIELGKLFYWNDSARRQSGEVVLANREKLKILSSLVSLFFIGGIVGALGFKFVGFAFSLPLALLLCVIGVLPAVDDLRHRTGNSR